MTAKGEEDYLNAVMANGMLYALFTIKPQPVRTEVVMRDGQATNQSYVWFPHMKSRYRITIEIDPEEEP